MARPGVRSGAPAAASAATRQALVDAAVATLRHDGFQGASARAIAARAGCTQGLVFYHFGSVQQLLLAALDAVAEDRRAWFEAARRGVTGPEGLVEVAMALVRRDLDEGHLAVLAELLAGAVGDPELAAAVATRLAPWAELAGQVVTAALGPTPLFDLVPATELGHGLVALFLGLELLSHLDGDHKRAAALFERLGALAALVRAAGGAGT